MILDPDKMFPNHLGIKIKILITLSHVIILCWLLFYEITVLPIFFGYLFWILYGKLGGDIGYHRLFSHKSFVTTNIKKRLLLVLGTLIGIGSSISWVAVHRIHHKYADTDRDPHSPVHIGIIRTWLTFWNSNWRPDMSSIKDIIKDQDHIFFHKNYFKFIICYLMLLSIISFFVGLEVLLIGFAIPNALTFHAAGLVDAICHKYGYQNYNTRDNSKNNFFVNLIMLGAGLHNNHHANPGSYTFKTKNKKLEFDMMALVIKYFLMDKDYGKS